ncbi:hypothetical protein BpHYR1_013439 [Brachionus plicatilis]|uniref:Uncharacterized protein n=1 Tax=Brachionus plicatilis TaxID=10195 RepID=A0A3M7SFM5_BRAPC|nr:hypothetical protein BpHYR1_013439 [Brachionus plicatilis]
MVLFKLTKTNSRCCQKIKNRIKRNIFTKNTPHKENYFLEQKNESNLPCHHCIYCPEFINQFYLLDELSVGLLGLFVKDKNDANIVECFLHHGFVHQFEQTICFWIQSIIVCFVQYLGKLVYVLFVVMLCGTIILFKKFLILNAFSSLGIWDREFLVAQFGSIREEYKAPFVCI